MVVNKKQVIPPPTVVLSSFDVINKRTPRVLMRSPTSRISDKPFDVLLGTTGSLEAVMNVATREGICNKENLVMGAKRRLTLSHSLA